MNEPTFFRQLRVVIFLVIVLIAIGTAGYRAMERWGLHDALFMTVITLSTVGYGEVRPLARPASSFSRAATSRRIRINCVLPAPTR